MTDRVFFLCSVVIIDKIQAKIDLACENGIDTTQVQTALDAFRQAVKDVNPIHQKAKGIIAAHKGFDDNGKVIDRPPAIETVKSLGQLLKDARSIVKIHSSIYARQSKLFEMQNRPILSSNKPLP